MERSNDRILTTHCGRLPNPRSFEELQLAKQGSDQSRVEEAVTAGIAQLLERQSSCGIDVMSDGEFFHGNRLDLVNTRLRGFERRPAKQGEPGWLGAFAPESEDPRFDRFFHEFLPRVGASSDSGASPGGSARMTERTVATGPIEYVGSEAIQRDIEMAKTGLAAVGADHTKIFYPQIGVGWLSHFVWNEYYKSEEEFAFALAEGLRGEYKAVLDAGFILQVDDPSTASRYAMLNPAVEISEYRKLVQMWVAAQNHALEGLPEDRVRYHVCWGSFHYPHTRDIPLAHIIDVVLSVNAGAYLLEGASVNHQLDYLVWEYTKLPDGKILVPGIISHATSNEVEPPELIAHRIVTYARLVGRENVMAGADCGPGGRCHDDVAWAKLESLGRGAALASKTLWG